MPPSYGVVARLHERVTFEDGPPDEIMFGDCNLELSEAEEKRYIRLCDAGQNWFAFDTKHRNKMGEPRMILVDHGSGIEEAGAFPDQDKQPFGVGGMLLRCLAYRLLGRRKDLGKYSWG